MLKDINFSDYGEVILGDCVDWFKEQKDKSFDVVFTSPPYNRLRNDTYAKFNDINKKYFEMLCCVTKECLRVTKGNVIINIQSNMYNKADVAKWQGVFADKLKGVVVWAKTNPVPAYNHNDGLYSVTNAYENFYVFGDEDQRFKANNSIFNYICTSVNSKHVSGHSAVMKLEVAEWFIENFTREGDLVLDPFFGVGTTGVACAHLGRRFTGVEVIPEYKEESIRRIKYTIRARELKDLEIINEKEEALSD